MENSCSNVLEKVECSILWPNDESYKFWKARLVPSGCFIKDLSIDKVLDEVGFERTDREKSDCCLKIHVLTKRYCSSDWTLCRTFQKMNGL